MADPTKEAITQLIHRTPQAADGPTEYEMDDYQNADAVTDDDLIPMAEQAAPAEEEEQPPAEPEADWKAIAQRQEAELARYKTEQASREKADFERRVQELPEAERAEFVINFYRERERAAEVDQVRKSLADKHPVGTMLVGLMGEDFNMEIEDPSAYAEALAHLDTKGAELLDSFIREGVKREMDKFYAQVGAEWGSNKIGAAQPRPLVPRNPVRNQYEQQREALAKPGVVKTTEELTNLIRRREMSKRGM